MFVTLFAIARNTFTETIRQPIYGVLLLATAILLVLNIFVAGFTLGDDNKLLMDLGLSTMLLSGLFLAAFSATGVLTREIENKTVMTIISKPVSRPVFVLGKFVGLFGAQFLAFYISFLIFVLSMHHKVLQNASDPWDFPAIIFGGGFAIAGLAAAACVNFFYGKDFASAAVAIVTPVLTVGVFITMFIDREWKAVPFAQILGEKQLFVTAFLIMLAIMILAAVALAASTRLGQVMTLMACAMVMIAGFLSDWVFGQYRDDSVVADLLYRVVPNLNYFWVVDAATADIPIPGSYLLLTLGYAVLIVVAVLAFGVALFERREVG
jgi:hypothetical protein